MSIGNLAATATLQVLVGLVFGTFALTLGAGRRTDFGRDLGPRARPGLPLVDLVDDDQRWTRRHCVVAAIQLLPDQRSVEHGDALGERRRIARALRWLFGLALALFQRRDVR